MALLYAARLGYRFALVVSPCGESLEFFPVALLYTARSGCMILTQVCSCGLSVWDQIECIIFTLSFGNW